MIVRIIFWYTFVFHFVSTLSGQVAISSLGGDASSTGGAISFTVGQVVYTAQSAITGNIIQGVQQPYEIIVVSEEEIHYDIQLLATIYPNPVNETLSLRIDNSKATKLTYRLYDLNGRPIENKSIVSDITKIEMTKFISGSYFLKIYDDTKEVKTFKIIKK